MEISRTKNTTNQTVVVTSFSKVTFGGGGLSFMAAASDNLDLIKRIRGSMVICPDKVNQKRHTKFFKDLDAVKRSYEKTC